MEIRTHLNIDPKLCGTPKAVESASSRVTFEALPEMAADATGLVHGGFVFGLADYAAMLAVNHPNVVLGSATVRFLTPVRIGETLLAEATVSHVQGKKHAVRVTVKREGISILEGEMICFVLERHVLSQNS